MHSLFPSCKTHPDSYVNVDGKVKKTDLPRVVKALGKKTTRKIHTDVNTDVADLLLVIDHLGAPKDAAAPAN